MTTTVKIERAGHQSDKVVVVELWDSGTGKLKDSYGTTLVNIGDTVTECVYEGRYIVIREK